MTAPAHPDRQGTREALAAALREAAEVADAMPCDMDCDPHACPSCSQPVQVFSTVDGRIACVFGEPEGFADALLPVVERLMSQHGDQRTAEALEEAAAMQALAMRDFDLARWLRDRAAALRPAATRENGAGE